MTKGRQPYRTVTVKISDLLVAQSGLLALQRGKPENPRLRFALASTVRDVERQLNQESAYMSAFQAITEEHGERDENGEMLMSEDGQSIRIKKESRKLADKQLRDLRAVDVELRVPSIVVDDIPKLGDLSTGDVASMLWLFEEQPYEIEAEAPDLEKE